MILIKGPGNPFKGTHWSSMEIFCLVTVLLMPTMQAILSLITVRSQSGILLFVNRAPILWYSKKQNTVETSTFGSKFVAMCIVVELI
jgi:hypothetical protein